MLNEVLQIDLKPLSIALGSLILILSITVQTFSNNYLEGDGKKGSFSIQLNLLTFSTLLLILTNHIWTFFIAWVLSNTLVVSLMIHKSSWKQAYKSGQIAFSYMCLGFIALFSGIFITQTQFDVSLFSKLESVNQSQELTIFNQPISLVWLIGFTLLLPAMIQSAQVPFSKWFLSSLNSPTPVSAFMHAGLINGGGILLIKFFPLINNSQELMNLIFIIGSITALSCSASMLVQTKIKNKLACSTAGQMGFMFMEIGAGFWGRLSM